MTGSGVDRQAPPENGGPPDGAGPPAGTHDRTLVVTNVSVDAQRDVVEVTERTQVTDTAVWDAARLATAGSVDGGAREEGRRRFDVGESDPKLAPTLAMSVVDAVLSDETGGELGYVLVGPQA